MKQFEKLTVAETGELRGGFFLESEGKVERTYLNNKNVNCSNTGNGDTNTNCSCSSCDTGVLKPPPGNGN